MELEVGLLPNLEKRRYPRVNANFEAEVHCENGFIIKAIVLDTSSSGLKLQCNSVERDVLTPRGEWTHQGTPIKAKVTLIVPRSKNKTSAINVLCAVAFSRRVANDRYHVGLRYLNFDNEGFTILAEFISNRIKSTSTNSR